MSSSYTSWTQIENAANLLAPHLGAVPGSTATHSPVTDRGIGDVADRDAVGGQHALLEGRVVDDLDDLQVAEKLDAQHGRDRIL